MFSRHLLDIQKHGLYLTYFVLALLCLLRICCTEIRNLQCHVCVFLQVLSSFLAVAAAAFLVHIIF